jgi:tripartite-type tricarboxylate transporter receptor subunit TctC
MRRSTFCRLLTGLAVAPLARAESGQRVITVVVPYAAGGGYDRIARIVMPKLSEALHETILIENRGGAGGTLGMAAVARAAPDGQTLVVAGIGDTAIAPAIFKKLPYNPEKDFVPLSMLGRYSLVLVTNAALPVNSVADLLQLARSRSQPLTCAVSSIGSTGHLAAEMFKAATGIGLVTVPYKGTSLAITDLVGGHVEMMFSEPGSTVAHIRAGRLKALAVSTEARSAALPEVPTLAELGIPNMTISGWWGLFAPAGIPASFVQQVNQQLATILKLPEIEQEMRASYAEPGGLSGEQFSRQVRSEIAKFTKVAKVANIKLD